ncbi:SDR family NAD(P)-dependent oxidoreductase [Lentisalinibacter sediminis]|uniref:SDR family NAD(P)-dependent oxidoreductase n=1 Tax=Lentisalinibacter sediminis TaxID=2992237 RepID=UPI00386AA560
MDAIFRDKTVIITGASAGIGAAAARRFAAAGARLVLAARNEHSLQTFAAGLPDGTEVVSVAMDVADDAACRALFDRAKAAFGAVHYLINNAGLHARGSVEEKIAEELTAMVDVNLRAPILLSRLAIPCIRQAGGGAIVNVASLAGCTPVPGSVTYAATKAGLRSFSHGLAEELKDSGIHVGAVSPGPVDTGFIMEELDEVTDLSLSQPMSTPEAVAEAILRVASGGTVEEKMPRLSGVTADLVYLFPGLRRAMQPLLSRKGKKAREYYKARRAGGEKENHG